MTRFIISIISQIVVIITFLGWGLYLWFHVKDFGPQKECNDKVKYVIMFVSIRATNRGLRDFYIFLHIYLSVGLLELLVLRLINMRRLFRPDVEETKEEVTRNDEGSARREEGPKALRWALQIRGIAALLITIPFSLVLGMQVMAEESKRENRPWYSKWPILPLLSTINVIAMLELTVWRNNEKYGGVVSIDNSWGFGQVLAVVMIIASLYEIGHVLLDRITLKRAQSGGLQAGTEEASQEAKEHSDTVS
ncbi:hypothetical protein BGW80DRAFT_489723 [Lactifluus volemus]|nr:hypothetical protein BGW80DRAFT_489723 [Lactifluus volemus]